MRVQIQAVSVTCCDTILVPDQKKVNAMVRMARASAICYVSLSIIAARATEMSVRSEPGVL